MSRYNYCKRYGGALYGAGTSLNVRQSTIVNNHTAEANQGAAAGAGLLENCIMWANGDTPMWTSWTARHSIVEGGYAGTGNTDVAPQFANDAGWADLRLAAGSPGIDAADATILPTGYPVDFDGETRALDDPATADSGVAVLGIAVDMGAFEFQPDDNGGNPDCPGDLNNDDSVDVSDLLILLAGWGVCP